MNQEPAVEKRTVIVDGVRQVYRVAGEGPVCLVHSGGPGVHPEYLRLPGLEGRLTMVYVDPVGCGDSDLLPDGDYSVSRYGRFAEAVLDDIGARTAYFLGHSHGGFVALQFGLDHPDRLDGLILYDTAPAFGPDEREAATKEMAAFVQRWADRPEAVEAGRIWDAVNVSRTMAIIDDESFGHYLRGILPAYFADHRRTGEVAVAVTHDPNRRPENWDVRDRLGAIGVPALVIVGTHDFICPPRLAYELHAGMPDARLCELRESGHFGHIEQADAFAAAVLDFVREQRTGNGE
ncbi:proline iminopeptidase [Nonomuraea maritima]|uniref:Proline iminopeptidase n=1 Tax=Nonomuraea maritima TaxID=683260 RepID=A0A1G9KBM9_9ACTN|nr:alpha/beta hydrolase [Nonomuraea maritima]SDL47026.1 proline iminopeptidase [Nonomuraea maritima]